MLSAVQEFYRGKTVLITGGTGFMGKVLVEKLLYSCSELEQIYLLLRPKRGQDIGERIQDMISLPMFQRIRVEKPQVLKKIIPIQGDVTFDNLGLDEASQKLIIANTNIVFHCAATVRLEAKLKDAIEMNLTGTHRMLCLAKQMKQLEVFLHLSTAFCYSDKAVLLEEVEDAAHNPHDVMQMAKWLDDKALDTLTPHLLMSHPNTYTYAKRLAEILINEERHNLPCVIARPSIVTPSVCEPLPGWVDNLNGPIGLMVGGGKGLVCSMLANGEYLAQVIPVDFAINALIAIPFTEASRSVRSSNTPVYNLTCHESKVKNWGVILNLGKKYLVEVPLDVGIWYPSGGITTCAYYHYTRVWLFQWLPAYLIDFLLFCFRQPRFMVRVQRKVALGQEILKYFTMREWNFQSEKYKAIYANLTAADKKIFNMDEAIVDPDEYIKSCVIGGRVYCMKEPLANMPRARRHLKVLYVLDRLTIIFFVGLFMWLFLKATGLYSILESSTQLVRTH